MTPHTKRKMIHYWRRQVRPILVLVLVFTAFRSTFADWNDVPTGSMKPTIFEGDRIFVNKLAYGLKFPYTTWHLAHWGGPKQGEIVVFYAPDNGVRLVKRCVAEPGQTITVDDGRITIDGKPLTYTPYTPSQPHEIPPGQSATHQFFIEQLGGTPHVVAFTGRHDPSVNHRTWKLRKKGDPGYDGEDEYFMMGDNRDNSRDARYFGPVPRDQILGRSGRVVFSLDYDDAWLPRKERFFHALK